MALERGNAQAGQTVRLRADSELGGAQHDPSAIASVEILDSALAVVKTFTGAAIVQDGLGLYHVDWTIPEAEPSTIHYDRWTATAQAGGTAQTFLLRFYVLPFTVGAAGQPYMTAAEARAYIPDTTLSDAQLQVQIALAQEIAETCTKTWFLPREESHVIDGNGERALGLPAPCRSLSGFEILRGLDASDDSNWVAQDASALRVLGSRRMVAYGNLASYSRRVRGFPRGVEWGDPLLCGYFPAGSQNIRLTGTWGDYARVPEQIKGAIGLMIRHAVQCDDPVGVPSAALDSESVPGGRAYTLSEILREAKTNYLTGLPEVDRILVRFRSHAVSVMTVV